LKVNDVTVGALLLAVSLAILAYTSTLPPIPGQNIGPAAFPTLLALILAPCAVALIARGWRTPGPWIARMAWTRSPEQVRNFSLTCAALVFYALFSEQLGFFLCGLAVLLSLLVSQRVKPKTALAISVLVLLFIHLVFYKLLRVPLPWGVLEPLAW
jgi:putative tricarboxylic transport membrane protein